MRDRLAQIVGCFIVFLDSDVFFGIAAIVGLYAAIQMFVFAITDSFIRW